MSTEAQKRASAAYNKRQDNIMIRPDKETGAKIRAAAAAAGQSVQAYIIQATKERMEREVSPAGKVDSISSNVLSDKDDETAALLAAFRNKASEVTQK